MKTSIKLMVSSFLIVLLLIGISGCGKKGTNVLRVGTNAEYPPFESMQGDTFVGVDIDIARKIAEKLEMEIKFVDMDFDTLLPSLGSNKIDMALSAISINDERKALVDFSAPYYLANQVIVASQESKLKLDDLANIGKYKVGSQSGTTGQKYLIENFVDKKLLQRENLKEYPSNIEAITDLIKGDIDFVIMDDSAAQGYSQLKPIVVVNKIETNENYAIAMPKNAELNSKINKALQDLLDSGEVVSIIQTHIR